MTAEDWLLRAACKDVDPDPAFDPKTTVQHEFAWKVCGQPCPVRDECLAWALSTEEGLSAAARRARGVLGGWTGTERHRIAAGQARDCADCGVMIVPLTWTHLRCRTCSVRHKYQEDMRRLLTPSPPVPATAEVEQLRPCGTHAGHERHRAAGERPCDDCADAQLVYNRRAKRIERARRAA